jgi:hypothetical protein
MTRHKWCYCHEHDHAHVYSVCGACGCPYGPITLPGDVAALLLEWLASDDSDVTIAQHEDLIRRTREMLG